MKALPWRWIVIGVVVYLLFLVVTIPATLITGQLSQLGFLAADVSGSVWRGRASAIQYRGTSMGPTQWRIKPLALLLGRLNIELKAKRDDGFVDADVSARLGGEVVLTNLRATLPLSLVGNLSGGMVGGWQGNLQTRVDSLRLQQGWPTAIKGEIDITDLIGPASQPTAIGSYRVAFTDAASKQDGIVGRLSALEGTPLDVTGELRLESGRRYTVNAQVGTTGNTPENIRRSLEYLGPPDTQGRRPLSVSGSL